MTSATDPDPRWRAYESPSNMTDALTTRIMDSIRNAIKERGRASLAVSGGSTPRALYERLAHQDADWDRVVIVLVDERWVEPGAKGSNETFVRETLVQGEASRAKLIGLKTSGGSPEDGLDEAEARLSKVPHPFDIVILGMGDDGHTASWFPHAKGLEKAIHGTGVRVAAIEARPSEITGPFTQRITLTRAALSDASEIHILLSGVNKRQTWQEASGPGEIEDMPVRVLIRDLDLPLQAHWAA